MRPWLWLVMVAAATAAAGADPVDRTSGSFVTASIAPDAVPGAGTSPSPIAATGVKGDTLTVVIGGDLGFSAAAAPVSADGAVKHGRSRTFAEMTAGLAPLFDADVVFANLETVVSDRPDLVPLDKLFNFRGHPAGLAHLVSLGVNAVSLANNHVFDYGEAGLRETLRHVSHFRHRGLLGAAGAGADRAQALAPAEIVTGGGRRVLLSALGIGAGGQPEGSTGRAAMASWGSAADAREAQARLAAARGDLRILSVHYGQEMQVRAAPGDERRLREAVTRHGVDLVVGHHAHVAAGVQDVDNRLIFFGLGNLMHPGMQDMARHGVCRDYGLIARVHYARATPSEPFTWRAVEAITLADMHHAPRVRSGHEGRARIAVLNELAAGLDDGGGRGVRFTPMPDGRGVACRPGAEDDPGAVGDLCRAVQTAGVDEVRVVRSCAASAVARRTPQSREPASEGGAAVFPTSTSIVDERALR
jgi:poly-gamma-glutamate synthesis protein (capsule biosynthesis protein)